MRREIEPGQRYGEMRIPASKSQAHRLLICAALGSEPIRIYCDGISRDIEATVNCLRAMGAEISEEIGCLCVNPIREIPRGRTELFCGESGSTLRFLLPLVGALGIQAVFHMEGRLPERPLSPLDTQLCAHGMKIERAGALLFCEGSLTGGAYIIPGDVSSQYVSGLLMALPHLKTSSTLEVRGPVESAPYIGMTEDALHLAGIQMEKNGWHYSIPGPQRCCLPETLAVEGDWSNAAFFLCLGALSAGGVTVRGLNLRSSQGDRAVLDCLRGFGAELSCGENCVTVKRGPLHAQIIDASAIPDLIPVLSVLASAAEGETRIVNAARLLFKESDRLSSTAAMLKALGAEVTELKDGLVVHGGKTLAGGTVNAVGDHRIAMSAAVASALCEKSVTVEDAQAVEKSYPRFWDDFDSLTGGNS